MQKINEYKYNTNCQPIDGECKKAKMQNTIKYKNSMNGYEKETWLFAFWLFVQRYFTSVPACLFLWRTKYPQRRKEMFDALFLFDTMLSLFMVGKLQTKSARQAPVWSLLTDKNYAKTQTTRRTIVKWRCLYIWKTGCCISDANLCVHAATCT